MKTALVDIRELKQRRRRRQHVLSCQLTKQWCLISRFVEDVNTRQRLSFSFPQLWYSLLEFNSGRISQHLTTWTGWNRRDNVWSSANSLFKWRFRSRRHYRCLKSLLGLKGLTDSRTIKSPFNCPIVSIIRPHTTDFDSDVDFRTGCGNVNDYQRQTFLGLHYINSNNLHSVIKKQVSNECIFKIRLVQCDYLWCNSSIAGST